VPQAVQRVSAAFAHLQRLRANTTQAFLAKTESSISKRMLKTRGYLEFVVDVAEKQVSQPSEEYIPTVILARLAEKALCIQYTTWQPMEGCDDENVPKQCIMRCLGHIKFVFISILYISK
jgi:hypothetical protein